MQSFLWGAATSSHQIEGENRFNDWWAWEAEGKIEGKVISGRATDHWNRFKEDLRLAASLGLNSYRFSVEWSRFEPKPGEWSKEAEDWYDALISECERLGLEPMLTLHHFTLPQWLADQGGLLNTDFPALFQKFTSRIARRYGARVPLWCTVNEPITLVVGQYLGGFMPPAKFAPRFIPVACQNLFRAHVAAYETLHSEIKKRSGPWKDKPLMVGFAHNMIDFQPSRAWHPLERMSAWMFRRFYNRSWLDAVMGKTQHFGMRGLVPHAGQVREARGKKTADFIGVNYYTKCYLHWGGDRSKQEFSLPEFFPVGVNFHGPYDDKSDLGWAVHPAGLGRILRFVSRYGLPIFITENGIADADDSRRAAYLSSHLLEVARAIERGMDIRGYYHWSLVDNFEWIKGFWPRFGLVEIDYDSFSRKTRESARFYQKVIAEHLKEQKALPSTAVLRNLAGAKHPQVTSPPSP